MGAPPISRLSAVSVVITIAAGLALDASGLPHAQAWVNLWAWGLLSLLLRAAPRQQRKEWLACLLIATAGEVVLSLIWGLYDYRDGGLPAFVPPGHVLLYALGVHVAARLPASAVKSCGALAALVALGLVLSGRDGLSAPLTLIFLAALRWGPAPRLYASMFLLSLAMELWGTALGNWHWRGQVPWLGWPTLNPPFAAGAFYCVLDWLVGLTTRNGAHLRARDVVPAPEAL